MSTLMKRDSSSGRFSLYVFVIIVGCVAISLIGFGLYTMYHGMDEDAFHDVSVEQRKYMREVRTRNQNSLAITARRPDMIVPIEALGH